MKQSLICILLVLVCGALLAQQALPRMTSAEPSAGKAGDVIAVAGENLTKAQVAKVYLTDGKNDIEVQVTEQTATELKFKIPAKAKGRLAIMIETSGKDAKQIEQPVKVTVE
jgi:hypothetical protein